MRKWLPEKYSLKETRKHMQIKSMSRENKNELGEYETKMKG